MTRASHADGTKAAAERDEHRDYLAKLVDSDRDPGVRRIAARLLKELDDGAVTKSATKPDGAYRAYLDRFAQSHPDPEVRARADAVLEKLDAGVRR